MPFPDGAFDLVTCQIGLMFVPDRAAAVAEMRRVLAPGGRLAVTTPGRIQPPFEAMEREVVDAWQPYVVDGRVPTEQPIVVATAHR